MYVQTYMYVDKVRKRRKEKVIREKKEERSGGRRSIFVGRPHRYILAATNRRTRGRADPRVEGPEKGLRYDTTLWVLVKNERKRVRKSIVRGRKAEVATLGMVGNRGSRWR